MSDDAIYRLQGDHFFREIVLSDNILDRKRSALLRLPRSLSQWHADVTNTELGKALYSDNPNPEHDRYLRFIESLSSKFDQECSIIQLGFNSCNFISSKVQKESSYKKEEFLKTKAWKKLSSSFRLDRDKYLDSMYLYPVIPDDTNSNIINIEILKNIIPKINFQEKIILLTGEMIWSGWISLEGIIQALKFNNTTNKILIIDSFGFIQQHISDENKSLEFGMLKQLTKGVVLVQKVKNKKKINSSNTYQLDKGLYVNSDANLTYGDEMYTPDYYFETAEAFVKQKTFIRIGMDVNKVEAQPLLSFLKKELTLTFPKDTILQKSEKESIEIGENIGKYPKYKRLFTKIKFPNQLDYYFNNFQSVSKNQLVAERKIIGGLLKEKILSPSKSLIDGTYKSIGVITYLKRIGDYDFISPFSGVIREIMKEENSLKLKVQLNSLALRFSYSFGKDFQLTVNVIKQMELNDIDKAVIVNKKELKGLDNEILVKYRIKALILVNCDFEDLRKLKSKFVDHKDYLTILLLNGFSIQKNDYIQDLIYLLNNHLIVKRGEWCYFAITTKETRELYVRLKSKQKIKFAHRLVKGEEVFYFNYSVYDACARIEKTSEGGNLLSTGSGMISRGFENISKYNSMKIEE